MMEDGGGGNGEGEDRQVSRCMGDSTEREHMVEESGDVVEWRHL